MPMFTYQNSKTFLYVAHKCEQNPDVKHFYGHTHEHYEVFFFVKGNVSFNIEGNIFKLSSNDIILIPHHQYHCLVLDDVSVYERYVLEIPLDLVPTSLAEVFTQTQLFNISENSLLLEAFHRLDSYQALLTDQEFGKISESVIQEILYLLKASLGSSNVQHSYDPLTKRILAYINENLTKALTVSDLSEHFYLSKSHIQNVFYQNMKIGVKSYIVQKKMLLAKTLLQSGKRPHEVAEALGYNDYATFYKNFKKQYHVSPKAFTVKK